MAFYSLRTKFCDWHCTWLCCGLCYARALTIDVKMMGTTYSVYVAKEMKGGKGVEEERKRREEVGREMKGLFSIV